MSDLFPEKLVYNAASALQVSLGAGVYKPKNKFEYIEYDLKQFAKQINKGISSLDQFQNIIDKSQEELKKIKAQCFIGKKHDFCDNNCELCEELNYVCEYFINKNNMELGIQDISPQFVKQIKKEGFMEGKKHKFCDNNCRLCDELDCVCEYFINKENEKLEVIHL